MSDDAFKQGQIEGAILRIEKETPDREGGVRVAKGGILEVLGIGKDACEELRKLKRALGPIRLGELYDSMQKPPPPNWLERDRHG